MTKIHAGRRKYGAYSFRDRSQHVERTETEIFLKAETSALWLASRVCTSCGSKFHIVKDFEYMMRPRPIIPTHNEQGEPIVIRKKQTICPTCADARKKRKNEKRWQKICKQCGVSFFSYRRDALTCGTACRKAWSRAKKDE